MSFFTDYLLPWGVYYLCDHWFSFLLISIGIAFTWQLGLPQISYFVRSWRILFRQGAQEGIFRSFATSIAGAVGIGSITGTAIAIYTGGPPALFWIWIAGFLGMPIRIAEVALSHYYRKQTATNQSVGGPMYFLGEVTGIPYLGKIYAIGMLIAAMGTVALPQTNSVALLLEAELGWRAWYTGILIAITVGFVLLGGIDAIRIRSEQLVLVMGATYFLLTIGLLIDYRNHLMESIQLIFQGVWKGTAMKGGFIGASVGKAIHMGLNYGFYSADVGTGASGIAYAMSKGKDSKEVAIGSMVEPFITACVIGTLTGLTLISSGTWKESLLHNLRINEVTVFKKGAEKVTMQQLGSSIESRYEGQIFIEKGRAKGCRLLYGQSEVKNWVIKKNGNLFSGTLTIKNGRWIVNAQEITLEGEAIKHSYGMIVDALTHHRSSWIHILLLILCFLLFAFTSIVAWGYYGQEALRYLGGARLIPYYTLVYLATCIAGSVLHAGAVWDFALIINTLMAQISLIGLIYGFRRVITLCK